MRSSNLRHSGLGGNLLVASCPAETHARRRRSGCPRVGEVAVTRPVGARWGPVRRFLPRPAATAGPGSDLADRKWYTSQPTSLPMSRIRWPSGCLGQRRDPVDQRGPRAGQKCCPTPSWCAWRWPKCCWPPGPSITGCACAMPGWGICSLSASPARLPQATEGRRAAGASAKRSLIRVFASTMASSVCHSPVVGQQA